MNIKVKILLVGLLTGCAATSGVVPVGNNVYMISRSQKGFDTTGSRVKADALRDANAYCAALGQDVQIMSASQSDMKPFVADAQAEVFFKCVGKEPIAGQKSV